MLWVLLGDKWTIALEYLALYSNINHNFEVRYPTIHCINLRIDGM